MLDKTYRPEEVESKIYASWEDAGAFACGRAGTERPYTIVIPPPNVTGSLHMGHALNNTLQDILIRLHRMRNRDTLWQPGTDHAGIATQMVVERQLSEGNMTRHDLGREDFVERVWAWKEESGGIILNQLRRLGVSADWSRERFTMDEGLSEAVLRVFVALYKQGLIYRDKRLVNWDCKLHTAISDLEVEQREVDGSLWHFKYPVEGEDGRFIVVATTRPETMLGDTAVAVHPDDDRYADLVGKAAVLPLVGRRLPIVADDYADPEQGSGAVKITPAHDFNDFEVGRRHELEQVNIFDENACLNDNAPEPFRGLDRYGAREKVVAELQSLGLVERIEPHRHTVPHGDRSQVAIEPWLTDQWYVDAAVLAKPAIAAVRDGRTRFVPEQWTKTYYDWMENIQPWCISRQLWWGHQIPAWYGPDGEIFVEHDEAAAEAAAAAHYGKPVELRRDEDVLDTWFSSALWPFSTLGWPAETPELARYYPTDVLVTGFDIIFFWVARMMMMGLRFMDEVPFHTVYIHALVRDEKGQKMSKSKGNIMDPLDLIDRFGADALRFTLTALAVQGRDVKLSESVVAGYRNFATKLWNAARFAQMNDCAVDMDFDPAACRLQVNKWIVGETVEAGRRVTEGIDAYKFNEAAAAVYRFTWNTFCDWYLEFAKPIFQGDDEAAAAETRATAGWALGHLLHLLHPFMPFVTEALWRQLGPSGAGQLITSRWPVLPESLVDGDAKAEVDWTIRVISGIRTVRADVSVPPGTEIPLLHKDANDATRRRFDASADLIRRLGRISSIDVTDAIAGAPGHVPFVVDEATVILPLGDIVDLDQERARLEKEIAKLEGEIGKVDKKLANEQFLAKAPAEVVEEQRERRAAADAERVKLAQAVDRLAGA